ncbi:MAG: MarR family transcriptional regulator [Pseudomonadota bacterium]
MKAAPIDRSAISDPGVDGDPMIFKVLTEIDMIAHLAETEFARALPEGLTPAQFGVLNRLMRLATEETVSELAAAFQVAQPTMSSTIKRLSDKGFTEFVADENDRRIRRVRVTPEGEAVRRRSVEAVAPFQTMIAKALPDVDWSEILPALTALRGLLGLVR